MVADTCCLVPYFGGELLPEFCEGHFVVGVKSRPGGSLEESLRTGKQLANTTPFYHKPDSKRCLFQLRISGLMKITGGNHAIGSVFGPPLQAPCVGSCLIPKYS